ncbi:Rop family plasmid primer RNA-binding protein [Salmonella enterica subsp. enterica serovar Kentucky]|uniref:Rop family plasmid primer RNA-binding protein n=1 Tax=Salmonella enterica TaxID=28901 RepID=UPI003F4B70AD
MTKQEKTAHNNSLNNRKQKQTQQEKLKEIDSHEQADICESHNDHADQLYRSCLARFCDDGESK